MQAQEVSDHKVDQVDPTILWDTVRAIIRGKLQNSLFKDNKEDQI